MDFMPPTPRMPSFTQRFSSYLNFKPANDLGTKHVEFVEPKSYFDKVPETAQLPAGVEETEEEEELDNNCFVGSIDQGTTSSRFIIFDGEGVPVTSHQIEFENMYPESG